jgi:2-oxo-3-hexenedioate decarboxylase
VPLSLSDSRTIAADLDDARRQRCAVPPPLEMTQLSLRDAYDLQDALVAARERSGAVRSGWKLGLTSRVKQKLMGIDHPLYGRLFGGDAVTSGSRVPFASFIRPRAEPEIAFSLAAPLDPNLEIGAQLAKVAWFAPALEITDSRFLPGARSAVELVADNTSAAVYVLGPRVPLDGAVRIDAIAARFVRNGSVLATGSTGDVLGSPLAALTLLARHLAARGLQTTAGDVVLSGAITDAFSAAPGDVFEAQLEGYGKATVAFV